jgi:hypothetical protein
MNLIVKSIHMRVSLYIKQYCTYVHPSMYKYIQLLVTLYTCTIAVVLFVLTIYTSVQLYSELVVHTMYNTTITLGSIQFGIYIVYVYSSMYTL